MQPEQSDADSQPAVVKLEPGDYFWCACGKSSGKPFCDGSHQGAGVGPEKFVVSEPKTAALCSCGLTADSPYCDGAHTKA